MKKLGLTILVVLMIGLHSCETEPIGNEEFTVAKLTSSPIDCSSDLFLTTPQDINFCTTARGTTTGLSFWDININNTTFAGDYQAWCLDADRPLGLNNCFDATLVSSFSDLSGTGITITDNFDIVNWIINQNFVGTASPNGNGDYTFGDVQIALWFFVDDATEPWVGLQVGDWNEDRVQEIIDLALAEGENFVPLPGDFFALIILPNDTTRQPIFIPYKLECPPNLNSCETAFARTTDGSNCFDEFGFKRWGWTIGPLSDGTVESYKIYAGAGQCDISKGEFVGSVDVSYLDGVVDVTYNFLDGVVASEMHTYAGNTMFPTNKKGKPTVAPGQYSIQDDLGAEIYVIAHAVVCGE